MVVAVRRFSVVDGDSVHLFIETELVGETLRRREYGRWRIRLTYSATAAVTRS